LVASKELQLLRCHSYLRSSQCFFASTSILAYWILVYLPWIRNISIGIFVADTINFV
jgi:hypothetical protein